MNFTTPLYNLNPLTRFCEKAGNYNKYRPPYPDAVVNKILEGLTLNNQFVAADIGAGTGISARQIASKGIKVIAVEPNAAMREVAESHQGVEWRNGTAEATNLPDASVDLITCFQAFHWFKPEPTLLEFRRILKPQGRLAVVFRDFNLDDEFTRVYDQFICKFEESCPSGTLSYKIEPLKNNLDFQYLDCYTFPYKQELDLSSLIGLAQSVSFISSAETVQKQLVDGLEQLHQRFCDRNGFVYLDYSNKVHLANVEPLTIDEFFS
ncbi:MAG: methyltransferase domain-containing protein [Cyanobacteria bacterium P01_A01_bin.68]